MTFRLSSREVFEQLHEAGVIADDPDQVRRVVLDLKAGNVAVAYVELYVDDEPLMIALKSGLKISGKEKRRVEASG